MLVCSGSTSSKGGTALLYTTDTLELKSDGKVDMDWQYRGPVYEMQNQSALYGTSWELPIILPVFLGLDGILWSFPAADILTFLLTVCILVKVYRELGTENVTC